jgi:hypothetical protein
MIRKINTKDVLDQLFFLRLSFEESDDYPTLHSKADRGGDEESTSRSMTRRQQRYANEGDLVLVFWGLGRFGNAYPRRP